MSSASPAASRPGEKRARATRDDAFALAKAWFDADERVDMIALASALGVGRTTLYRWVGDREHLLGEIMVATIDEVWIDAAHSGTGGGMGRAMDRIGGFIAHVAQHRGVRGIVVREPNFALRLLMDPDGTVSRALQQGTSVIMRHDTGQVVDPAIVKRLVQTSTALVWTNVAAGFEPPYEEIAAVARAIVGAAPGNARGPG